MGMYRRTGRRLNSLPPSPEDRLVELAAGIVMVIVILAIWLG